MPAELSPSGAGIALDPSPSIGYNTLACAPTDGRAAYVNGDDILVLRGMAAVRLTQSEQSKAPVTSLGFLLPKGRLLLGFTNRHGAHLFEENTLVATAPPPAGAEARGVAVVDAGDISVLVVGSSVGTVSFHTLGADMSIVETVNAEQHGAAVTSVAAIAMPSADPAAASVVSGDTDGKLVTYSAAGQMVASRSFERDCVTGLQWLDGGLVAASFGSGTVRIIDGACNVRIAMGAHNGWINCLAYHQPSNRLITGAEDGHVLVWSLPPADQAGSVSLLCHASQQDRLVCGAALDPTGQMLTVICYDIHKAQSFQLPPW